MPILSTTCDWFVLRPGVTYRYLNVNIPIRWTVFFSSKMFWLMTNVGKVSCTQWNGLRTRSSIKCQCLLLHTVVQWLLCVIQKSLWKWVVPQLNRSYEFSLHPVIFWLRYTYVHELYFRLARYLIWINCFALKQQHSGIVAIYWLWDGQMPRSCFVSKMMVWFSFITCLVSINIHLAWDKRQKTRKSSMPKYLHRILELVSLLWPPIHAFSSSTALKSQKIVNYQKCQVCGAILFLSNKIEWFQWEFFFIAESIHDQTCWTIINEDRNTCSLVAREHEIFKLSQGYSVCSVHTVSIENEFKSIIAMSVSYNHRFLALYTNNGIVWMGTPDLKTKYCEFKTNQSEKPKQIEW